MDSHWDASHKYPNKYHSLSHIEPKPYYWDAMYTDKKSAENARVLLVELSPGCTEYDEVKDSLDCTMQGKYSSIVKIQRVQNPVLYTQYTVKKKEVDKQNPPKIQNERLLFHGTSIDTCSKINELGFNRSFAGKNGKKLSIMYVVSRKTTSIM